MFDIGQLPAGSTYVDSGATATDNVDGNITSELSTFGLGAIDTTAPSNASDPFLITYDVSDSAGNAAVQGLRQVLVVCRSPAVLCTASDGTLYCSTTTGLCVQLTPPTAAVTIAMPPTIRLVGQAVLGVTLGSSYLACPTPQPTNVICDRSDFGLMKGLRCWAGGLCPFPPPKHMSLVLERSKSRLYEAIVHSLPLPLPLHTADHVYLTTVVWKAHPADIHTCFACPYIPTLLYHANFPLANRN